MKSVLILLLPVFMFLSCVEKHKETSKNEIPENDKKIIAYVNKWEDNWGQDFEKAKQLTHINYAFANIKEGKVVEGKNTDKETLKKLNQLKKVNEKLKILISVGGWSWSKNFSDAVLTKNSRQVFANSAIAFMLRHKIDGIDLDWEYPGQIGDNNGFRPEDKENFTSILKLLREKLDSVDNGNSHYLLTIASGANQKYLDHTNMKEAHHYLDFINIMTYDFYVGGSGTTGHHANLFNSGFDNIKGRSATKAVQEHVEAGIPIEKIVLGVPFYGRWWKGVNPKSNGLYQEAIGGFGSFNYKIIADSLNNNTFVSYWDESAKSPYIWREKDSMFVTYENIKSIQYKIDFIKNEKLGGIMFWQFNGDNGDLLKTIYQNLKKQ